MKRNDLLGQRFSRLCVIGVHGVNAQQRVLWACRCDCGGTKTALAYDLRAGKVKSCGCLKREGTAVRHGMARKGALRNPAYSVWATMLQRCNNPRDRNYANYGGRGISVCRRWHKFENFWQDMGPTYAPGLTLERKKNDRGYSLSNCVWASYKAQARNRQNTVYVRVSGKRVPLVDALRHFNRRIGSMHYYMRKEGLDHQGVVDLWQKRLKTQ